MVSQTPSPDSEIEEGASIDLVIAAREETPESRDADIYRVHGEQNFEENPSSERETFSPSEENLDSDIPSREGGGTKHR